MDLQEDPSPLPGDPSVDHHRRLDAANQVWQGPYWAVRTQNRIPMYVFNELFGRTLHTGTKQR
jgi:hypothetical protein